MATFAERLKFLRTDRELTRHALSNLIGISHSSINMYERGEREPGLETLEIIADYFNVDMDYLLGRQDVPRRIDLSQMTPRNSTSDTTNLFNLTKHEHNVISSYRNHPEMQPAVDKLLGVTEESHYLMPVAAHNDNQDDDQLEKMQRDLDKL
ncbi:MAG: helix-turn-helix domain-containing protein [Bacteroidales bacterium]|nr:helix-turn-helix transcriptional regulator [Anaerotignum sp.]MCI5679701.1 helix-turn-helix domain-containing protein [Bacteroidales bacterium]MDY3925714.1 helix-turn-helix transcriptional regulator [Anaerotignum sp.]